MTKETLAAKRKVWKVEGKCHRCGEENDRKEQFKTCSVCSMSNKIYKELHERDRKKERVQEKNRREKLEAEGRCKRCGRARDRGPELRMCKRCFENDRFGKLVRAGKVCVCLTGREHREDSRSSPNGT